MSFGLRGLDGGRFSSLWAPSDLFLNRGVDHEILVLLLMSRGRSWSSLLILERNGRLNVISRRGLKFCWNPALSRRIPSGHCRLDVLLHSDVLALDPHAQIINRSLVLSFFGLFLCHKVSCCLCKSKRLVFLNCEFVDLLFKSDSYVWAFSQKASLLRGADGVFFCLAADVMHVYALV